MNVPCPKCGKPREARSRTRWTRSSTRPGTSCATVDPHNDQAPWDRRDRRLLDAGRPVHRRDRPRDRPPAVLALLRQGAERLRPARRARAVRSGCSTRAGCDRAARRCRSRRATSRARTTLADRVRRRRGARCTSCSWAPPTRTWSGPRGGRGHLALPAAAVADRERGRPSATLGAEASHGPDARRTSHDRPRDRRHRPPLPVQHADRGRDGARQRARPVTRGSRSAVRRGDGRLAAPAVHAAHHRGAVVAARPRAALGGAVARGRSCAARARDVRAGDPGQRPRVGTASRWRPICPEDELVAQARASTRVQEFLDGKEIRKEIVVPGSS